MNTLKGAVLAETALVLIPFLLLSVGATEFLWYVHMKSSLSEAAYAAAFFAAADHEDLDDYSVTLKPYEKGAVNKARTHLADMGFSSSLISVTRVEVGYLEDLEKKYPRLAIGKDPVSSGKKIVAAVVSVPFQYAMIFGDFGNEILGSTDNPSELSVIALMWKDEKMPESGGGGEGDDDD